MADQPAMKQALRVVPLVLGGLVVLMATIIGAVWLRSTPPRQSEAEPILVEDCGILLGFLPPECRAAVGMPPTDSGD